MFHCPRVLGRIEIDGTKLFRGFGYLCCNSASVQTLQKLQILTTFMTNNTRWIGGIEVCFIFFQSYIRGTWYLGCFEILKCPEGDLVRGGGGGPCITAAHSRNYGLLYAKFLPWSPLHSRPFHSNFVRAPPPQKGHSRQENYGPKTR
jgi:hypothetical protein